MKYLKFLLILFCLFFSFAIVNADNNKNSLIVDYENIDEYKQGFEPMFYSETILEETHDVLLHSFLIDVNNEEYYDSQVHYKYFNISHYFSENNKNLNKTYSFNQGKTHVIKNTIENKTKEKTIEIKLNLNNNTEFIYFLIDYPQSSTIPSINDFDLFPFSTIEVNTIFPKFLKINKKTIVDNTVHLILNPNISNFSLQAIELDNDKRVTGLYSTNILQLDADNFNNYTLFQTNKNIIEFYCPYCYLKDYGVNENGFPACGKTNLKDEVKSTEDYLLVKENICLIPDGSKISGFTNDSFYLFGLDKLYFGWDNDIPSDFFDYGEYYVDQDQFRIAVSKKLDSIKNNESIQLDSIIYKKGKNNLISKVGTYIDFDLSILTAQSPNTSILDSLNFSFAVLNSIPKEYKKLTILDIVNNNPDISDNEFNIILQEILVSDFYKVVDYYTHYQISLDKYLKSFDNFKRYNNLNNYSNFLYNLETITRGYSNIYFSEGLNYFIYNLKPFDRDVKNILNNEYTRLFGNFWKINLLENYSVTEPTTAVINISDISLNKKEVTLKIKIPTSDLFVDYFLKNKYYSYNFLFYKSINALSFNRGDFFEKTNSVNYQLPTQINNYDNLQEGKILQLDANNPNGILNFATPIIITKKDKNSNLSIKYSNEKGNYNTYSKKLVTNILPDSDVIVIYPPRTDIVKQIKIESPTSLLFNKSIIEDRSFFEELNIYDLVLDNDQFYLKKMINDISKGNICFSTTEKSFSLWKNNDSELAILKDIYYNEIVNTIEPQKNSSTNLFYYPDFEINSFFANYTVDELNEYYKEILATNLYIQAQIDQKGLDDLKNYKKLYDNTVTEATLKNINKLIDCKNTVICNLTKLENTAINPNTEKSTYICIENTPTECVNFWNNPKINYSASFTKYFLNNYFGYSFDSTNAWDIINHPNNISIWRTENSSFSEKHYSYLIPGMVLAIKHNNTSNKDKIYSHLVVYLGNIGSSHYIIHTWNNRLKIEKLDVFLKTTARGKNKYGFYENGEIKEIFISNDFYQDLKLKAIENNIFLEKTEAAREQITIPDYIFDSYNNLEMVSDTKKTKIELMIYKELEDVYNNILNKEFDIYYKTNYYADSSTEINEKIRLLPKEPMIIILGKYKKLFLVNKENNETKILSEYSISTGANGFGCINNSSKTPVGLFRIAYKIGPDCKILQIIDVGGCKSRDGKPVIAPLNAGKAEVVTRKLIIDGLEKGNIAVNCQNGNKNTIYRGIFIHGTNYENSIGQQRSGGCIRMYNKDVINLFNSVSNGTYVYIYNTDTSYSSVLGIENDEYYYNEYS